MQNRQNWSQKGCMSSKYWQIIGGGWILGPICRPLFLKQRHITFPSNIMSIFFGLTPAVLPKHLPPCPIAGFFRFLTNMIEMSWPEGTAPPSRWGSLVGKVRRGSSSNIKETASWILYILIWYKKTLSFWQISSGKLYLQRAYSVLWLKLTLIRMAGDVYDSQNFEQKQSKWTAVQLFFILDLFLRKFVRIIPCSRFLSIKKKYCFRQFFYQKGDSHKESSLLSIGRLGVIHDSQLHSYPLFYSHPD